MSSSTHGAGAQPVEWRDQNGVRTITLNRPDQLNAINLAMIESLEEAILSAQENEDIRVLHLRGQGRAFCAGDDVHAQSEIGLLGEGALRAQLARLQHISALLVLGNKLSVAEVRGWAVGAGFSWALNCDFQVWGEGTRAFFPEVGFGTFVTGGATYLLPTRLGAQTAANMLFLGAKLDASQASAAALVHSICPDNDLAQAVATLCGNISALPQRAADLMKRSLAGVETSAFRSALEAEVEACVATTLDPQTLERMRAAIGGS